MNTESFPTEAQRGAELIGERPESLADTGKSAIENEQKGGSQTNRVCLRGTKEEGRYYTSDNTDKIPYRIKTGKR